MADQQGNDGQADKQSDQSTPPPPDPTKWSRRSRDLSREVEER
jgi:hypothetical protein